MLVPNLHWIIVEDSEVKTDVVSKLLGTSGMKYTHLNAATPKEWKLRAKVVIVHCKNGLWSFKIV